jgi:hypothetical protein
MTNQTQVQHQWSYDADDNEIRSEADGSVLFDIHNASGAQADLAASAPDLLAALSDLLLVIDMDAPAPDSLLGAAVAEARATARRARGED